MNRNQIEYNLSYHFHDVEILFNALRHRSYVHENPTQGENNEKLEFLGDSVLELALTHLLLKTNPTLQEGDLSLLRSRLVNEEFLAKQARKLNIGSFLLLGRGEENSGGRNKPSLLADALEAILGAIYLDSNFESVLLVIENLFQNELAHSLLLLKQNHKSALQQWTQTKLQQHPQYKILSEKGPEHQKEFEVGVFIKEQLIASGSGFSKREAEQNAAQAALIQLQNCSKSSSQN